MIALSPFMWYMLVVYLPLMLIAYAFCTYYRRRK